MIRFEWDEDKNLANQRKHFLSFETACLVFDDPLHRSVIDRVVDGEQRWQTMGMVEGIVVIVVAHTFYDTDDETIIRLISARKATRHERRQYEEEIS
ncbi:MAG: BrnT family toxin [Hyphomicrobiaceae bacterium]